MSRNFTVTHERSEGRPLYQFLIQYTGRTTIYLLINQTYASTNVQHKITHTHTHLLGTRAEFADDTERLSGKGLVELKQIDIRHSPVRLFQL